MKAVKYTIYHEPVAQGRPRFARGRAYDPPKSKAYKELVALCSRRYFPEPLKGALKMQVVFSIQMPKSLSKSKKVDVDKTPHSSRPDIDNLCKALLDGLNGVAFEDDGQVVCLQAWKFWSSEPKIEIEVWTYDD